MSTKNPQLPNVCGKYGAPMGRPTCLDGKDKPLRCFRLRFIDGCYDEGGAYWGMPADVHCATNEHGFQDFCRANTRWQAIKIFEERHGTLRWKMRSTKPKQIDWT